MARLNVKLSFLLCLLGGCYFLYVLPSTGFDYEYYKQAFENAYVASEYPWFKSDTVLTAEPLYIFYTSLIGILMPFGFNFFLVFNFIFCAFIGFSVLNKYIKSDIKYFFWLFLLPVIFPTIFYFSPRSSISFILILSGFFTLISNKKILALALLFAGVSFHSQFLLITALIIGLFFLLLKYGEKRKTAYKIILIITLLLFTFLSVFKNFLTEITSILSVLPTADFASSKLMSYSENDREGFRFTGILSIIVYPFMIYLIEKRLHINKLPSILNYKGNEQIFYFMLVGVVFAGAAINLAFITTPHMAGRLSRFSDYVGMIIVLPIFLKYVLKNNTIYIILFILSLLAPILYSTLYYNVEW